MSVIAAKVTKESIELAADSAIMKGETKRTTNFAKLIKVNNMIIGGVGLAGEIALFQRFCKEHSPKEATVDSVQDFLLEFMSWKEPYDKTEEIQNEYLLVYNGKLFESEGIFVRQIDDYTAIGGGECFALAALHLGHSVEEAVRTTCELYCLVSEPINVIKEEL